MGLNVHPSCPGDCEPTMLSLALTTFTPGSWSERITVTAMAVVLRATTCAMLMIRRFSTFDKKQRRIPDVPSCPVHVFAAYTAKSARVSRQHGMQEWNCIVYL